MKMKRFFCVLIATVLFLQNNIVSYAASASKTAYVYGFNFRDGKVDTTAIAKQEQMYLSNMGYTAYCNTEVASSFAIGTSPTTNTSRMNVGVVAINGHAGPGCMQFMDANGNASYLSSKKSGGSYCTYKDIDMSNCKAALFYGCKTASSDRKTDYGVLTEQATSNGAKCSFGFKKSVSTSSATTFRERMFYFLRKGYSVSDSAHNAASEMPWNDSTRKYSISGDGSTKLYTKTKKQMRSSDATGFNSHIYDINDALAEMSDNDYRLAYETSEGGKVYVHYINDIPTIESIEINENNNYAIKTGNIFNENDYDEMQHIQLNNNDESSLVENSLSSKINDSADVFSNLTIDGNEYTATGESSQYDLYCKVDGDIKLLHIEETEYIDSLFETYYLDVQCTDYETGVSVDYSKILESVIVDE